MRTGRRRWTFIFKTSQIRLDWGLNWREGGGGERTPGGAQSVHVWMTLTWAVRSMKIQPSKKRAGNGLDDLEVMPEAVKNEVDSDRKNLKASAQCGRKGQIWLGRSTMCLHHCVESLKLLKGPVWPSLNEDLYETRAVLESSHSSSQIVYKMRRVSTPPQYAQTPHSSHPCSCCTTESVYTRRQT